MHVHALLACAVLGGTALTGCQTESEEGADTPSPPIEVIEGPLGMTLSNDGITYAAAHVIDITPEIKETFDDVNGNGTFDGCFDDPLAERCAEGFNDTNGNGRFDAIFMGGFDPRRPANATAAPISVRALVLTHNAPGTSPTQYMAWVTVDLVGLTGSRIAKATDLLHDAGFDRDRIVVTATHNHQAPDTVGLFGDPLNLISGFDEAYLEQVTNAIEQSVRQAAAKLVPVTLHVGQTWMHQDHPYFDGSHTQDNPKVRSTFGMVNDIRDPLIISDQLLVIRGTQRDTDSGVFTLTSWAGHPEVEGGDNLNISADWVGVTRDVLETKLGGTALHVPESLGGMQSALFLALPKIDENGIHHHEVCSAEDTTNPDDAGCHARQAGEPRLDSGGQPVPIFSPAESREVAVSHGWLIAEAAERALVAGEPIEAMRLDIDTEPLFIPVDNPTYEIIMSLGVLDIAPDEFITDAQLCPEMDQGLLLGCLASRVFRIRLGTVEFLTAPAEVTPELAWGLPDDPAWLHEASSMVARGSDSSYFPQHPTGCETVSFDDCKSQKTVGDCDCLSLHASPFILSDDPSQRPLLELSQAKYKAMVSMTDAYFSYALPEPDIHYGASLLEDYLGDHFEDAITMSYVMSGKIWQAHDSLNARW